MADECSPLSVTSVLLALSEYHRKGRERYKNWGIEGSSGKHSFLDILNWCNHEHTTENLVAMALWRRPVLAHIHTYTHTHVHSVTVRKELFGKKRVNGRRGEIKWGNGWIKSQYIHLFKKINQKFKTHTYYFFKNALWIPHYNTCKHREKSIKMYFI